MSRRRASKKRPQPPRKVPTGLPAPSKGITRACDIAAGVIAGVMLVSVIYMSRKPVNWPRDCFSDMHTLLAGENFKRHGLFDLRFLPVHCAGPEGLGEWRRYYTHYPPLSDVVNGIVRLAGIDSLSGMRIASALFAIAGFVLMYGAIRLAVHPLAGAIGLAAIAGSGYFWCYGVSVHQHPFNMFFMGLFMLLLVRAVAGERTKRRQWAVCWGALMLAALSSFEFIMYPQVFAWVYVMITGRLRRHWKALLVLATAPIAGVGLHYLQNVWAIGWAGAWADKLGYGQYGGEDRLRALGKLPKLLSQNISRGYGCPWYVLALLVAVVASVIALRRDDAVRWRRALALLGAASVAPWAWYLIMAAHAHHPHTINQIVLLTMTAFGTMGCLIALLLFRRNQPLWLAVPLVAGAVLLGFVVHGKQKVIRDQTGPKYHGPYVTAAEALGSVSTPPKSGILFNMIPEAHLAYYLRNYATLCPRRELKFPDDLARLDRCLPKGWRYDTYLYFMDDQERLFNLLRTNCRGKMLVLDAGGGRVQPLQPPVFLFDISPLHLDPNERPPLPPEIRQRQLAGQFDMWSPPGFTQRLVAIMSKFRR